MRPTASHLQDSLEDARYKVADVLRAIGADDIELALVVPVIGYILGLQTLGQSDEAEPERLKRQIFMTLRTVLERRLSVGPLVLVVEDLQWADAASLEGLHTLSDWLCERPLMVVLSGRPPFDPIFARGNLWHVGRNHRTHRTSEIARQTPSGSAMSSSSAGTSACLYSTNG